MSSTSSWYNSFWEKWYGAEGSTQAALDHHHDHDTSKHMDFGPFPDLPTELHLAILAYSLPSPSYINHDHRTRLLLDLALLGSPELTRWSQRQLHKHPRLHGLSLASRFLRHITDHPQLGEQVRSLRLGLDRTGAIHAAARNLGSRNDIPAPGRVQQGWWGNGEVVGSLLAACPNVQELWVVGLSGLDAAWLNRGQNLRLLAIVETRLTSPFSATHLVGDTSSSPPVKLPHLHTLHLRSVILAGAITLSTLLNPIALPSLRSLAYLSVHHSLVTPSSSMPPSLPAAASLSVLTAALGTGSRQGSEFEAIAEQLTHLALGEYATKTLAPSDVLLCSKLETLDVPMTFVKRLARVPGREVISRLGNVVGIRVRRERVRDRDDGPPPRGTGTGELAQEEASRSRHDEQEALRNLGVILGDHSHARTRKSAFVAVPPPLDQEEPSYSIREERLGVISGVDLVVVRDGPWDDPDVARDAAFDLGDQIWTDWVRAKVRRGEDEGEGTCTGCAEG